MSVQAAVARLVTRYMIKNKGGKGVPLHKVRKRLEAVVRAAPNPPFPCDREEVDVAGVPCTWFRVGDTTDTGVIVYFHGGGYVIGSPRTHRSLVSYLARVSGAAILSVDYRLAPEHPYPAALEDATAVYRSLLDTGIPPQKMAVGGDSAGGGLTFATLVCSRDQGLPMPAAAFAFSPWTDLSLSGASITANRKREALIHYGELQRFGAAYRGDVEATNPLVSPLFADLHDLPPTLLQVSAVEMLRDDSLRLAQRLEDAGVSVTCDVARKLHHVWQFLPGRLPEARASLKDVATFLNAAWA